MKGDNVIQTTVEHETCSGCGVCEAACPTNAITIKYTENKTFEPRINTELCIHCAQCSKYCANEYDKRKEEAVFLSNYSDPVAYGIEHAAGYFRCKTKNQEQLMRSASGGFVTAFAKRLLEQSVIDCVVHAERVYAHTGEPHYRACISETAEQLDARRSSIYGPVSYHEVLKELKNSKKRILVIGVPCAVSSIKSFFKYTGGGILYTIALVCSHNVTGQFVDFMAEYYGIPKAETYVANLRGKNHDMKDRGSFHLHYTNTDGKRIVDVDRRFFNPAWRNYYFAMDACNYCSDLWGREADISCKDCWGQEGDTDQYGSSLAIFRNASLMKEFLQMKDMEIDSIPFESVRVCEYPSAVYKQKDLINRIGKAPDPAKDGDRYQINSMQSKRTYREKGMKAIRQEIRQLKARTDRLHVKNTIWNSVIRAACFFRLNRVYKKIKPIVHRIRSRKDL